MDEEDEPQEGSERRQWLLLAIFWTAGIAVGVSIHGVPLVPWILGLFPGFDKFLHLMAFAVLTFFWMRALGSSTGSMVLVLAFSVCYAMGTEVFQDWVPGRTQSLGDFMANLLGAGLGVYFAFLMTVRWIMRSLTEEDQYFLSYSSRLLS
jgi:hypothetical protein